MFDFENSTTYVLTQLATANRNILESELIKLNLHSGQILILIALWKSDGQSQIELVKKLNLSAPTVNKMVQSLAANGFVECRKCASDGRLLRVFLTAQGSDCQDSIVEIWEKIDRQTYTSLTDTEKLILTQLFGKLRVNLSQNQSAKLIDD